MRFGVTIRVLWVFVIVVSIMTIPLPFSQPILSMVKVHSWWKV